MVMLMGESGKKRELKGQLIGQSTSINLGTPAWSVKTDWQRLTIRL